MLKAGPAVERFLHIFSSLEVCRTLSDISIGEDIEATLYLLLDSSIGALVKGHQISSLLLSKTLVACCLLGFVTDAVTGLLVPLTLIFLLQTVWVFDGHIQWVVHKTVQLHGDGQFLNLVLSMNFCLSFSLFDECLFFRFIAEFSLDYVVVIAGPVLICTVGLLHSNIRLFFVIVVLEVSVCDDVVLAAWKGLHILASDSFWWIGRGTLIRSRKVMFLHRFIADNVPVDVCVLAWAEVPRLLLGVVRSLFEALQLILEVENIVRLLIAERSVLVLS